MNSNAPEPLTVQASLSPQDVAAFFTHDDGSYFAARWERPIAPVVFGLADETLATIKGSFDALTRMVGLELVETDPELGANCMMFFMRDWTELLDLPDLDHLIGEVPALVARLQAHNANQYRTFRFDTDGGIKACFVFLRMDQHMLSQSAEELALTQIVQCLASWAEGAFRNRAALARIGASPVLRPDVGLVLRALYDETMPAMAKDDSHALRMFARISVLSG